MYLLYLVCVGTIVKIYGSFAFLLGTNVKIYGSFALLLDFCQGLAFYLCVSALMMKRWKQSLLTFYQCAY